MRTRILELCNVPELHRGVQIRRYGKCWCLGHVAAETQKANRKRGHPWRFPRRRTEWLSRNVRHPGLLASDPASGANRQLGCLWSARLWNVFLDRLALHSSPIALTGKCSQDSVFAASAALNPPPKRTVEHFF